MERNLRKTRVGLVSSDKMDKTVVVSIQDRVAPVSYTHLDVYKRQAKHRGRNGFEKCPPSAD